MKIRRQTVGRWRKYESFKQFMRPAHTLVKKKTDHARCLTGETGVSPAAILYCWGQASSRKQSECGMHGFSNILELIATFLYSIYHQRAGKTNLFHMRGGRFHAGNTLCTFKCNQRAMVPQETSHLSSYVQHRLISPP